MRVCAACGLIAVEQSPTCAGCRASLGAAGATREAEGAVHGAVWMRAECGFVCRVCGRRAPLAHLDGDDVLFCALCATEQAFQPASWRGMLEAAHDIGDLCWPKPEGRSAHAEIRIEGANPYHDVGIRHALSTWEQDSSETDNPLFATLGPGHPLCRACREPLSASWEGDTAQIVCLRCGEEVFYTVPAAAKRAHKSVVAVVADDHRKGAVAARIQHGGATAAVAVACPTCGASLAPDAASPWMTCAYCKTLSRVPARAFHALTGAAERAEPFWLLLWGPSVERQRLVDAIERERAGAGRRAIARRPGAAFGDASAGARRTRSLLISFIVLATLIVGAIGLVLLREPRVNRSRR